MKSDIFLNESAIMHPNPVFRHTAEDPNLAFLRDRGFGTLLLNGEERPLIAHVPFVLSDDASYVDLHLVRSNPIARRCKQASPATLAASGPDSYISPDWYQTADQVPTWNYIAVHLVGRLEPLPAEKLSELLSQLSYQFETRLAPKPEWTHKKMTPGEYDKMLRMIIPFRFHVEDMQSTWKLNQNKSDAARKSAADAVALHGIGSETETLAQFMRTLPKQEMKR